jgi:hypothetical protein
MSVEKYNSFTFHSYRSGTYLTPILHTLRSYGAFHALESIIFSNTKFSKKYDFKYDLFFNVTIIIISAIQGEQSQCKFLKNFSKMN